MNQSADTGKQYCTFRLATFHCGIDVMSVREIFRQTTLTTVPTAPPVVKGLINLRGHIITALDMRIRLSMPPRIAETPPVNIVVSDGNGHDELIAALVVDEIGDVIHVRSEQCEPPPDTIRSALRDALQSVCKLETGLLLICDVAKLMHIPTSSHPTTELP